MSHFDTILGMALADEGGGGGSSDFSTAIVTIYQPETPVILVGSCAVDDSDEHFSNVYLEAEQNTVILYKGLAAIYADQDIENYSVNVSGSVEYISDAWVFLVSGNCTINITA